MLQTEDFFQKDISKLLAKNYLLQKKILSYCKINYAKKVFYYDIDAKLFLQNKWYFELHSKTPFSWQNIFENSKTISGTLPPASESKVVT